MREIVSFGKLKSRIIHSRYYLRVVILSIPLIAPLVVTEPTAFAAQTFSAHSISSSYTNPSSMTVAGGATWYVESATGAPADYIGKMTTSGTTTDYSIGGPYGIAGYHITSLTTGPDGNVWFDGINSTVIYSGYLNISTGAVTFYSAPGGGIYNSYSDPGSIVAGSDGNMYYTMKSNNTNLTYLLKVVPTTGVTTVKQTYDNYTAFTSMTSGSDGRLWLTDSYANKIWAQSVTGGTSANYVAAHSYAGGITSGPDGNLWFIESGYIAKMTTSGTETDYAPGSGVSVGALTAGPDGAVWFTDNTTGAPKIGRITSSGVITEYAIPGTGVSLLGKMVRGSDDAMWYTYQVSGSPVTYGLGSVTTAPSFSNYSISSSYTNPSSMTVAGGATWYVESATGAPADYIGKMTTSGTTTDYSIGGPYGIAGYHITSLTTGPDGNVWFDGINSTVIYSGYLNISTGAVTFYSAPGGGIYNSYSDPGSIVAGSDGNMYYTMKSNNTNLTYLLKVVPTTGVTTVKQTYDNYTAFTSMTSGSDGRLWLTDSYANKIWAQSVTGGTSANYVAAHSYAGGITSGPDGNLWFIESGYIAKMTTSGTETDYAPGSGVSVGALTAGPDGAVWFTDNTTGAPKIGRITSSGVITEYAIPGTGVSLLGKMVRGSDDAMWYTYQVSGSPVTYGLGRLGY